MIARIAIVLFLLPGIAAAQELAFPGSARLQTEVVSGFDRYRVVVGPWHDGAVETVVVEGNRTQQAWRLPTPALTTTQLLRPLREQLRNDGYRIVLECQDATCGGFDFRFALDVLPPPHMLISLGDFAVLVARKEAEGQDSYASLIASRTARAGYVQADLIGPSPIAPTRTQAITAPKVASEDLPFAQTLTEFGRVVLADLQFESGSAQLGAGPFVSLSALAAFLSASPNKRIALVGHTDASGTLAGNLALSQRRAASVLERLVTTHGVARAQLQAEGVGFLAPISSNASEEGRMANRRVEAVLISTTD